uniref:Uncharacterized protein n=1 Tax=Oryza punctata TaxID=4537 RepID=A0A0E0L2W7_ORYPU
MERSEQFVAAAALRALLPTPPRSKMVPLLPTPCLIILPASSFASPSKPKPGRADAVERWEAHKTGAGGAPPQPPPPPTTMRRDADRGRGLCRADACDRWDINKTASPSRSSSSSPSSSSSEPFRRGSRSSRSPARSSSSRASSDERWDVHKKPRLQAGALNGEKDRNAAMTMSLTTDKEISKPRHAGRRGVESSESPLPVTVVVQAAPSPEHNNLLPPLLLLRPPLAHQQPPCPTALPRAPPPFPTPATCSRSLPRDNK